MHTRELYCSACRASVGFEQPPCQDGHGRECDEWSCVHCGAAILADPLIITTTHLSRRALSAAQTYRAA